MLSAESDLGDAISFNITTSDTSSDETSPPSNDDHDALFADALEEFERHGLCTPGGFF